MEYTRTVNNNTYTNDEMVQVEDVINNDIESDDGSNCNMEDSDFVVDDEEITNLND